ncbi:NAD-dependent epimerase/dehydratase family protein [Cytobacillus gottheilii]|uniref:NAD-dependent epimerase/dehydratase family protein n=1 Tax=Cytobacillus gottheilii TaxID=859144 RepID=UPI00082CE6E8|nr:NAD(P)-dependent oxidoreductase [Cytobacillus gottheilii]
MGYVLVTGCNGFVGSRLIDVLLEKGYKVLGLSTGKSNRAINEQFNYISVDITDSIAIEKIFHEHDISEVIHLAAIAHRKNRKNLDWNKYYRVNTLACKTIFQCATRSNTKIFYASSVDVYGNINSPILTEDLLSNPISDYAKSKYLAEIMLEEISKRNSYNNYVIARFAPVYAKGYMKDAYKRIYIKYPNIAFTVGKGYSYHFVSVNNVIDFAVKWLESNEKMTGTYNVCDSKLINSKDFVSLEKKIGNSKNVLYLPNQIFTLVKLILDISCKILKKSKLIKLRTNIYKLINPARYSTDKMEKILKPNWDLEKTVYQEND